MAPLSTSPKWDDRGLLLCRRRSGLSSPCYSRPPSLLRPCRVTLTLAASPLITVVLRVSVFLSAPALVLVLILAVAVGLAAIAPRHHHRRLAVAVTLTLTLLDDRPTTATAQR
jgi:hypothetical protein